MSFVSVLLMLPIQQKKMRGNTLLPDIEHEWYGDSIPHLTIMHPDFNGPDSFKATIATVRQVVGVVSSGKTKNLSCGTGISQ